VASIATIVPAIRGSTDWHHSLGVHIVTVGVSIVTLGVHIVTVGVSIVTICLSQLGLVRLGANISYYCRIQCFKLRKLKGSSSVATPPARSLEAEAVPM